MFNSILVVCVGNICRSPTGERLLQARLPHLKVASAGLAALVGKGADPVSTEVAAEAGVSLDGHVSRQFTAEIGSAHDVILVMEPGHRAEILRMYPQLSGKTMLFDQWTGAKGIDDPYRLPRDVHEQAFKKLVQAADAWALKLNRKS